MEQTNRGAAQRRRRSLLIYRFPRRAAGRRRQRRSIDQSERRPTDELRRGYASRRQSSEEMVAPVAPVFLHVFLGGNFLLSSCVYGGVRFLPDKLERCGLGSFYFLDTLLSFLSPRRGCISNSKRKKKSVGMVEKRELRAWRFCTSSASRKTRKQTKPQPSHHSQVEAFAV